MEGTAPAPPRAGTIATTGPGPTHPQLGALQGHQDSRSPPAKAGHPGVQLRAVQPAQCPQNELQGLERATEEQMGSRSSRNNPYRGYARSQPSPSSTEETTEETTETDSQAPPERNDYQRQM